MADGSEALAAVRKIIPPHAEAMTASSTTLIEIGLRTTLQKERPVWNILHAKITAENDPVNGLELAEEIRYRRIFHFPFKCDRPDR